jgi:uncharacterized membrane protein YkvA (DUF1232 family)
MELSAKEKEQKRKELEEFSQDRERVLREEEHVRKEFGKKYGKVGEALVNSKFSVVRDLAVNVASMYEMLVDPDYQVSWQVKAGVVFALAYFISPVDAVPDTVPVVGYVDDALVVAFVCHLLRSDIADYREFRRKKGRPLPST